MHPREVIAQICAAYPTLKEAAVALGVSARTLNAWRRGETLPKPAVYWKLMHVHGTQCGGDLYYSATALEYLRAAAYPTCAS